MIRVCYLFPLLVFMLFMGILYRVNNPEIVIENQQGNRIDSVKTDSPTRQAGNNAK